MQAKSYKLIFTILLILCIAFFGYFIKDFFSTNEVYAQEATPKNSISVNGSASIKVKPDIAYINVGVETEGKSSKLAQQDNAKDMNEVYSALEKCGIKNEDIKTIRYNIYPVEVYNEKDRRSYISGYRVINEIQVTVKNIEKAGDIIDATSQNGANRINKIMFGISDNEKYYLEALELACKKAKAKADVMTKSFGIKLTAPSQIIEGSSYYPVYDTSNNYMMKAKMAESYEPTPIASGELEVSANVSLIYNY